MYRGWRERFAGFFDIRRYQPPGRETRFDEPPHGSVGERAAELLAAIADQTDDEFALFGHSLGALVAFEAARLARRTGAARAGATDRLGLRRAAPIPGGAAAAGRAERRGVPRAAAGVGRHASGGAGASGDAGPHLPPMRADLAMLRHYPYLDEPPLDLPLLILGGSRDPLVQRDELAAWAEQTTGDSRLVLLDGGHFYWTENEQFADVITAEPPGAVTPR